MPPNIAVPRRRRGGGAAATEAAVGAGERAVGRDGGRRSSGAPIGARRSGRQPDCFSAAAGVGSPDEHVRAVAVSLPPCHTCTLGSSAAPSPCGRLSAIVSHPDPAPDACLCWTGGRGVRPHYGLAIAVGREEPADERARPRVQACRRCPQRSSALTATPSRHSSTFIFEATQPPARRRSPSRCRLAASVRSSSGKGAMHKRRRRVVW